MWIITLSEHTKDDIIRRVLGPMKWGRETLSKGFGGKGELQIYFRGRRDD